jgi:MFS family permease
VVQTHISTAPVAGLVGLASLAGWVYWRLVRREGRRSGRAGLVGVVVGSAAAVTIWIPPTVELFRDNPNNLTNLWHFFTQSNPTHSLHQAFHLSIGELTILPFGNQLWAGELSRTHWQMALGLLGIAVVAIISLVVSRRRRQWLGMATTVFSLVSFPIGVVATSRTVGDLMAYLAVWESIIPAMLLIGLAIAVFGPDGRGSHERADATDDADTSDRSPRSFGWAGTALVTAVVIVVASLAIRADLQQPPVAASGDPTVAQLTASANRVLTPQDRWVDIDIVSHDSWGKASGLALELEREGHRTTVSGPGMDWTLLFGAERRSNGREDVRLSLYLQNDSTAAGKAAGPAIGSVDGEVLTFARLHS